MKKMPIGIDNFYKLVDQNYYFVDKSLFIKGIVEEGAQVLLIPRPRRFGKSLNMSMLKYFFTSKNAEKNRELFNGLKIEKETEIMKLQGKYPLIYISFKDVKDSSWENCYSNTKDLIQSLFDEFNYVLESPKLSKFEKIKFDDILLGQGNKSNYESSLKFLSKLLYNYHGVKPIILIDEYDQALITAHTNGYFKEAMNFYRNFLSSGLKDNENFERAILTGILRVAKESIFSGLNNLKVDSILKNQFNYFGLSEEEVLEALKYYKRDYEIQEVKEWYNGYTFGKNLVYNPWSIINFIDNDELTSFWVNTSTNDLIRNGLSNLSSINYKQFVKLINLEPIEIEIEENISFEMLDNPDVIWNLMLFSGYLTLNENKLVSFPNKEVRDFYITEFKRLAGYSINSFNSLLGYLMNKDIENFKTTAYVGGEEKEGVTRKVAEVGGSSTGLSRDEVFINATDIVQEYENESGQTVTLTNAQYLALLSARGVEELEQYAETLAFGSKINTNANLKYGTDYDLGDRVTCINKRWNVRIDVRITEIAETYETSGEEIDITFGESLPALLTQIRQITK